MFSYPDDLMGVPHDKDCSFLQWSKGDAKVVFSYKAKGTQSDFVLDCHFAANKKALRHIRQAINEFCSIMFEHDRCLAICAAVKRSSVERLVKKCGFTKFGVSTGENINVYARLR